MSCNVEYIERICCNVFLTQKGYFITYKSSTTLDPPRPLPGAEVRNMGFTIFIEHIVISNKWSEYNDCSCCIYCYFTVRLSNKAVSHIILLLLMYKKNSTDIYVQNCVCGGGVIQVYICGESECSVLRVLRLQYVHMFQCWRGIGLFTGGQIEMCYKNIAQTWPRSAPSGQIEFLKAKQQIRSFLVFY